MRGNLQVAITGLVAVLVFLFVGIFMIAQISAVQPENQLKDYTYSTVTNNTALSTFNITPTQTHGVNLGIFASIENEDYNHKLTATIANSDTADHIVNVSINGAQVLSVNALAGATTTATAEGVTYLENQTNNITYTTSVATDVITVDKSDAIYASGTVSTEFGDIFDNLTSNTSTIYSILILVLVIAGLAIAIGYLNGMGQGGGRTIPV